MPETIKIILLGVLQGFTEFLPVSSSGHLVLGQYLLGLEEPGITLEIILHIGTLLSVIAFYNQKILDIFQPLFKSPKSYHKKPQFKLLMALLVGSIPAGLVGFLLSDFVGDIFANPRFAAFFLIVTGLILLTPKVFKVKEGKKKAGILSGFVIGIAQAIAILPGISRSGSTITMGRILKLQPEKVAEFSFLLSIPAILGATLLDFLVMRDAGGEAIPISYIFGAIASAIVGYIAILIVIKLLISKKLHYFAYYVIVIGIIGLIFIRVV